MQAAGTQSARCRITEDGSDTVDAFLTESPSRPYFSRPVTYQ